MMGEYAEESLLDDDVLYPKPPTPTPSSSDHGNAAQDGRKLVEALILLHRSHAENCKAYNGPKESAQFVAEMGERDTRDADILTAHLASYDAMAAKLAEVEAKRGLEIFGDDGPTWRVSISDLTRIMAALSIVEDDNIFYCEAFEPPTECASLAEAVEVTTRAFRDAEVELRAKLAALREGVEKGWFRDDDEHRDAFVLRYKLLALFDPQPQEGVK